MTAYEEHTERQWFVRDRRGAYHPCTNEATARYLVVKVPDAEGVVLYRDVVFGPLVGADQ